MSRFIPVKASDNSPEPVIFATLFTCLSWVVTLWPHICPQTERTSPPGVSQRAMCCSACLILCPQPLLFRGELLLIHFCVTHRILPFLFPKCGILTFLPLLFGSFFFPIYYITLLCFLQAFFKILAKIFCVFQLVHIHWAEIHFLMREESGQ